MDDYAEIQERRMGMYNSCPNFDKLTLPSLSDKYYFCFMLCERLAYVLQPGLIVINYFITVNLGLIKECAGVQQPSAQCGPRR